MRAEFAAGLVWSCGLVLLLTIFFYLGSDEKRERSIGGTFLPVSKRWIILVAGFFLTALQARKVAAGPKLTDIPGLEHDLRGKVVVCTGAAAGIGTYTALEMAMRGATVVLGCRSSLRVEYAAKRIRQIVKERHGAERAKNLVLVTEGCPALELESFLSVREFALWVRRKFKKVDILISNAGLIPSHSSTSGRFEKDLEQTMVVNFLSPLLLTELLVDITVRIVIVGSTEHAITLNDAKREFEELALMKKSPLPRPMIRYRFSKLGNAFHAHHLVSEHMNSGENAAGRSRSKMLTAVACVHPGFCNSSIMSNMLPSWMIENVLFLSTYMMCKTDEEGATTTCYAALVKDTAQKLPVTRFPASAADADDNEHTINFMAVYLADCQPLPLGPTAQDKNATNEVMKWALALLRERKLL